ncbi:MAG: IS66 family insertion sequence element accessory protein TnpB [Treponema sp.]|nr:IS66 family insertion sequence element accessory protein TnpB [Treponema sp.]
MKERKENTVKNNGSQKNKKGIIVLKPGATDLRREENALSTVVTEKMNMNARDGSFFIFANKKANKLKMIKADETGTNLYKKSKNVPVQWPEYGQPIVILKGNDARNFLEYIGFPGSILD